MRIALDAMGGDFAPAAAVEGGVAYARRVRDDRVILVGEEGEVRRELERQKKLPENLSVQHAPEVVSMDDHPGQSVRKKPRSSIRIGLELVQKGVADAFVSAGNSGAVMAAALVVLGRVPGVERPALVTVLPTLQRGRHTVLLDSGANVTCRPLHLVQFAFLGEVWSRRVLGRPRPRVALLSNGEEDSKGTETTRQALLALRKSPLDFAGYVEGKDVFTGDIDVLVTDGFTGNVVLKTTEGAASAMGAMLRREIEAHAPARLGALLMQPAFLAFRKIVDYAEVGGAPLVGVNGTAVIAHGRSSPKAISNAMAAAAKASAGRLTGELGDAAERAARLLRDAHGTGEGAPPHEGSPGSSGGTHA